MTKLEILANLILIGFNVTNVFIDAYKIKVLNKTIRHFINFAAYATFAGLCIWLFQFKLWPAVVFGLSAFFNRQITFDIPLSLRRGLKWDYVSLDRPPKAAMDRLEVAIFGYNGRTPVYIYSALWIVSLVTFFSFP